ncbi:hypothetical protein TPL01_20530 [Sulfuriferula plumbiphila]|uniref:Uncharacterized protein n=1 Tax=Sulfuriferula plumbiphila TaxID=171865 RepID=A0A512L8U5_9PROT|nr:hypothetical protein [Sulfuriferula plumbiphila]BBP04255.1 hypothetical protein SFPGR_16770 [Sulfuriferula plumbiphila]GEP30915.1 hypothetical protein TPL01_20530 [Sulfuriferula plumbiphila]
MKSNRLIKEQYEIPPSADMRGSGVLGSACLGDIRGALFPDIQGWQVLGVPIGGIRAGLATTTGAKTREKVRGIKIDSVERMDPALKETWRMPPLDQPAPANLTLLNRIWMIVLRAYLVLAAGLLRFKLVELAF